MYLNSFSSFPISISITTVIQVTSMIMMPWVLCRWCAADTDDRVPVRVSPGHTPRASSVMVPPLMPVSTPMTPIIPENINNMYQCRSTSFYSRARITWSLDNSHKHFAHFCANYPGSTVATLQSLIWYKRTTIAVADPGERICFTARCICVTKRRPSTKWSATYCKGHLTDLMKSWELSWYVQRSVSPGRCDKNSQNSRFLSKSIKLTNSRLELFRNQQAHI